MVSVFMTSCTDNATQDMANLATDDSELLEALYSSETLVGKGEVKNDNEYSFAVKLDDLSDDLKAQLENKESFNLNKAFDISSENLKNIWGDSMHPTLLEQGIQMDKGEYTIKETYMTEDGKDMTAEVAADPTVLDRVDVYVYISVTISVEVTITGNEILVDVDVEVEACAIIVP